MDQLKNPIVIGIITFAVVFMYLKWDVDRKYQEDPQSEPQRVNVLIPGVAAALTWFLAASQMGINNLEGIRSAGVMVNPSVPYCLQSMVQSPLDLSSVELLQRRNLRLPKTDVFIDLGNF